MAFPLAHPAAVLPLKRYCPRFFGFPALVVGSLIPDAGYLFSPLKADEFSHRFIGSFGFCLPAGLVMLWLFYRVRSRAIHLLAQPYQRLIQPLCLAPRASLVVTVFSLLAGAWTHLIWDSLTHKNGWLVAHLPILHSQVAFLANRRVRVCHLLWFASSFVGIAWLVLAYTRWLRDAGIRVSGQPAFYYAILVPLLLLPVELIRYFTSGRFGIWLVAACTLLLLVAISWCFRPVHEGDNASSSRAEPGTPVPD